MLSLRSRIGGIIADRTRDRPPSDAASCGCSVGIDDALARVDARDCPHDGALAEAPACRQTVVEALEAASVAGIEVRTTGRRRRYPDGCALFAAAARFAPAVALHDERLAARARQDPLAAAQEATGRAGPAATLADRTGLATAAGDASEYATRLRPAERPVVSDWTVTAEPPLDAELCESRPLSTGSTVRIYRQPDRTRPRYHLDPISRTLEPADLAVLADAQRALGRPTGSAGATTPASAVATVTPANPAVDVETIRAVLRRHTRGLGLLEDVFADPAVSDAFLSAPAAATELRVRADDRQMRTNLGITERGVAALASRFRRESARGFSRASPTLAAGFEVAGRRLRVAGVTDPASPGTGFAFRVHDDASYTLPGLLATDTLSPRTAGLLSVAVERGAAVLLAGSRGAGKTTTLGALCWELPAATRTVVLEDTPELPVGALQDAGRDVQPLRTDSERGLAPASALRTALRLGNGALVVGEVRGEEAAVLYEAMRVGATAEAVLGTIHGEGVGDVRERVVSDLDVAPTAFATTDLVVSLTATETPRGTDRRLSRVEEVTGPDPGDARTLLAPELGEEAGPLARGEVALLDRLAEADDGYADVLAAVAQRGEFLADLAERGTTAGPAVAAAHARRRTSS
jgi:flagellar protein FlaI